MGEAPGSLPSVWLAMYLFEITHWKGMPGPSKLKSGTCITKTNVRVSTTHKYKGNTKWKQGKVMK